MLSRKHTIDGAGLLNMWDINIHELSYLILKHDISVLEPSSIPRFKFFFNPDKYKIDTAPLLEIIQNVPSRLYKKLFWLPELEGSAIEKDLSSIKSKASSQSIEKPSVPLGRYYRPKPKIPEKSKTEKETTVSENKIKDVIEIHEEDIKTNSNVFSLMGKVWFVKFKQQEWGLYPDQEKYKYIANLLSLAATESERKDLKFSIYNAELVARVKNKDISELYQDRDEKEDLNDSSLADELSDEEIDKFKELGYNLLEDLNKANDSGDQKRIADANEKISKYRSFLFNEHGIKTTISNDGHDIYFKKYYRSNKEQEKIRQLIKNQTRNAIKDFNDRMPTFRMHLESSINPKLVKSMYIPEKYYSWHVSM